MKLVKLTKRFFTVLLISVFVMIFPFSARADDVNMAVNTGDHGIIGIIVAAAAFIATAFITVKLTKHNNIKIKENKENKK